MSKTKLSLKGQTILRATGNGKTVNVFDWPNALFDALIIFALTFFITLGASSLFVPEWWQSIVTALISGAIEFFMILAIKSGIRDNE